MMDKFEYKGIWWLPDKPEKKISGTLRFTHNEGAILLPCLTIPEIKRCYLSVEEFKRILKKVDNLSQFISIIIKISKFFYVKSRRLW